MANEEAIQDAGEREAGAEVLVAEKPSKKKAPAQAVIELTKVSKTYYRGKEPVEVLKNLDLSIDEGSFEALMGPSGSGKSTLLNLIAGLDSPTAGSVRVAGAELSTMSEGARAKWRSQNIGFVFQTYNMMPVLTALENVELPLLLTRLPGAERRKRAQTALRRAIPSPWECASALMSTGC